MRAATIVALVFCALACKPAKPAQRDAAIHAPGPQLGTFKLSYYWVAIEADITGRADTKIFDKSCAALAKLSTKFVDELATAGTGQLVDGRTLTVAGECECPRSPCFRELPPEYAWGVGAGNRALIPFQSVAVDRAVIKVGTPLYLPALDGLELPTLIPTFHDGCVVADDVGGSVDGQHIDWFVARRADYRELDALLQLKSVTVHDGGARCL